jgi:hypothetical protein
MLGMDSWTSLPRGHIGVLSSRAWDNTFEGRLGKIHNYLVESVMGPFFVGSPA